MALNPNGLSKEAAELAEKIGPLIAQRLAEIQRVAVPVLIWGANPDAGTPLAAKRLKLRDLLRNNGHLACFSEELVDGSVAIDPHIQQVCQIEHFDLIVSVPGPAGSIGEAHDFARDPESVKKLIIFVNKAFNGGYSNQSLMGGSSMAAYRVIEYDDISASPCIIEETVLREVKALRVRRYFRNSGRTI